MSYVGIVTVLRYESIGIWSQQSIDSKFFLYHSVEEIQITIISMHSKYERWKISFRWLFLILQNRTLFWWPYLKLTWNLDKYFWHVFIFSWHIDVFKLTYFRVSAYLEISFAYAQISENAKIAAVIVSFCQLFFWLYDLKF